MSSPEERRCYTASSFVISVNAGRNIVGPNARKISSMSDLYCIVKYSNQRYETPVVKYTDNPVWGINCIFEVDDTSKGAFIYVRVYEDLKVGRQFVGQVMLPVMEHLNVSFEMATQHWFPLIDRKRRDQAGTLGEIGLRIGFPTGDSSPSPRPRTSAEDLDSMSPEAIYKEASDIAEASYDSVQRSLRIINQTVDIGHTSLAHLQEQGGRIATLQREMDKIDAKLDQADRRIRSIESPWGTLANKLTKSKNKKSEITDSQDRKISKKRHAANVQLQIIKEDAFLRRREYEINGRHLSESNMVSRPADVRPADGEHEQKFYRFKSATDFHLHSIGNALQDLKVVAITMGNELQEQNDRLVNLTEDFEAVQPRIKTLGAQCKAVGL